MAQEKNDQIKEKKEKKIQVIYLNDFFIDVFLFLFKECLNQKKCRARFGLDQQANWCKHCKRKKKCLRYTENETASNDVDSWSEEDDTDNIDDSNDCDIIPIVHQENNLSVHTGGLAIDSDEENKLKLLKNDSTFHHYPYFDSFIPATANEFKREI
jgi:hypothetical protein